MNAIGGSIKKLMGLLRSENPHVTDEQWRETERRLAEEIDNAPPPTIAMIGLAGVGKSSTINALFNSGAPVSHYKPWRNPSRATCSSTPAEEAA
jgi:uncharacterized protein